MAYISSNPSGGNWSSTSTWQQVTNTPTLHASTNIGFSSAAYTATYTAPNTTNACVGVWIYLNNTTGAAFTNTVTVTLQENTVDTAAVKAISVTQFTNTSISFWKYFRFATPYVFTTTSAGAYRFKVTASATTLSASADSGGTLVAFLAVDDRAVASVGATDDVYIGSGDTTTTTTVVLDGTQTAGSGTSVGARSLTGVKINQGGVLSWDTASSSQLTSECISVDNFGTLQMGTTANPIPAGVTAKLFYNVSTGLGSGSQGYLYLRGTPPTIVNTTLVSGVGTAASPMVVSDAVDWTVGDELMITPSASSAQFETRYIITKNSTTSYVLSSSVGGSETAFTYTHATGCHIINVERNVYISTTTPASLNLSVVVGATYSALNSYAYGAGIRSLNAGSVTIAGNGLADYLVVTKSSLTLLTYNANGKTVNSLIVYDGTLAGGTSGLVVGGSGNTLNDCFVLYHRRFPNSIGTGNTYNRMVLIDNNYGGFLQGGGLFLSGAACTFNDCEVYLSSGGVYIDQSIDVVLNNLIAGGTLGNNSTDIMYKISAYADILFNNSNLNSTTKILYSNNLVSTTTVDMVIGSKLRFQNYQDVANTDYTITKYGYLLRTGDGLTDTTVRTSGTGKFALRFEPLSSTDNLTWDFTVPTGNIEDLTMTVFMWVKINSATYYAGTHQNPRLTIDYDNGTTSYAEATDSTAWQLLHVTFTPTTTYGQITVTVSGRTDATSTSAYFYIDDFGISYPPNVALDLGGLDNWANALPVTPPVSLPLSAGTVAQQVALDVDKISYIVDGEIPIY